MKSGVMLHVDGVPKYFEEHRYALLRSLLEPTAVAFYYQSA